MNEVLLANYLGALSVRIVDGMSATSPLSDSSRALLETLHFGGGTSATLLAEVAGLTQPAAKRALDRLRAEDLVDWPETGRTRPVSLLPKGKALVMQLVASREALLRRATSALTQEEQETLAPLIDRMLSTLTGSLKEARYTCRFCDHGICDGAACPVGERARKLEGDHDYTV